MAEWAIRADGELTYCDYGATPEYPNNCWSMPHSNMCDGGKLVRNCPIRPPNLKEIKNNILTWGLSSEIPAFEKYIYDYWVANVGLNVCNSTTHGNIENNYVCRNGFWRGIDGNDIYCLENNLNCSTLTDSRDGTMYRTITIDNLTLMMDPIKYRGQNGNLGTLRSNVINDIWGHIWDVYTYYTLSEAQNACPTGWRLPNNMESECVLGYEDNCRDPYIYWTSTSGSDGSRLIYCVKE
jgi:hypothetical protein